MNWSPQNLFHCLNNDAMTWLTVAGAIGVVFWYVVIAFTTWLPAAHASTDGAKAAIYWMAAIFLVCAIAGYGMLALGAFYPREAYAIRIVFLVAQNFVAPWFLLSSRGRDFRLIGKAQRIGQHVIDHPEILNATEKDQAAFVIRLVNQNLELARQLSKL